MIEHCIYANSMLKVKEHSYNLNFLRYRAKTIVFSLKLSAIHGRCCWVAQKDALNWCQGTRCAPAGGEAVRHTCRGEGVKMRRGMLRAKMGHTTTVMYFPSL